MLSVTSVFIFTVSFPLFLPLDPEIDTTTGYDYPPDGQPFAAEQQGKQNPFDHSYFPYSFSLMLALEF